MLGDVWDLWAFSLLNVSNASGQELNLFIHGVHLTRFLSNRSFVLRSIFCTASALISLYFVSSYSRFLTWMRNGSLDDVKYFFLVIFITCVIFAMTSRYVIGHFVKFWQNGHHHRCSLSVYSYNLAFYFFQYITQVKSSPRS